MEKIGYTIIKQDRNGEKPATCINCGKKGSVRVTFADRWTKLTVTLCKYCAEKNYEALRLQSSLDWPGVA